MSKFCMNCGKEDTLKAVPTPIDQDQPFLERGEFNGDGYDQEQEVTVLECSECKHEMVHLG